MATKRKTPATSGRSKKGGLMRTLILIGLTVILLAAIALSISYFYIKNDRKSAPGLSEIKLKEPKTETILPQNNAKPEALNEEKTTLNPKEKSEKTGISVNPNYEGTWVSTLNGSMLTLKGESFLLDFPSVEKKAPLNGHYVIKDNSITFIGTGGDQYCGSEPGQYSLLLKGKDLIITKVNDQCSRRVKMLEAEWFRL